MVIVEKLPDKEDKDTNYFCCSSKTFVFNNYKTATHYGQQILEVPEDLVDVLNQYSKIIPAYHGVKFVICRPDGQQLTYSNTITRIMNRIFGQNLSSSMLRHIFLTTKYDVKEMKEIADSMGHDLQTQRDYLKLPREDENERIVEKEEKEEEPKEEEKKTGGFRIIDDLDRLMEEEPMKKTRGRKKKNTL
jgi:hypothetical protein